MSSHPLLYGRQLTGFLPRSGWGLAAVLIAVLLVVNFAVAADIAELDLPASAPVIVDGTTLLRVSGVSSYPAESRAARIADNIRKLAADSSVTASSFHVVEEEGLSRILAGDRPVMVVTDNDARREGSHRSVLTKANINRIAAALEDYRRDRSAASLVRNGVLALVATVGLVVLLWLGARLMRWLDVQLENRVKHRLKGLEQQSMQRISGASWVVCAAWPGL